LFSPTVFAIFDILSDINKPSCGNLSEIKRKVNWKSMCIPTVGSFGKEANSVTSLLRIGSLLMILLLGVPIVRDCCLPLTQAQPCHAEKHDDDVTCSARQQAVAENKAAAVTTPVLEQFDIAADPTPRVLMEVRSLIYRPISAQLPANDIYLRTGTLLI
jgi:hypothetical protein